MFYQFEPESFASIFREQLGKLRLLLQRGLESLRLVGNHGVTLDLAVHLARSFESRVVENKVKVEQICDVERASEYWKTVVGMLEGALR